MNKPYFCRNCFLVDWRHKRLKNTIDLFLFYGQDFFGFSESEIFSLIGKSLLDKISINLFYPLSSASNKSFFTYSEGTIWKDRPTSSVSERGWKNGEIMVS